GGPPVSPSPLPDIPDPSQATRLGAIFPFYAMPYMLRPFPVTRTCERAGPEGSGPFLLSASRRVLVTWSESGPGGGLPGVAGAGGAGLVAAGHPGRLRGATAVV